MSWYIEEKIRKEMNAEQGAAADADRPRR